VYLPAGATLLQIESQLTSLAQLGEQFGAVSPVCFDAFARFTCANTYPKCVTSDDNSKAPNFFFFFLIF
jgi:hypothetical protein